MSIQSMRSWQHKPPRSTVTLTRTFMRSELPWRACHPNIANLERHLLVLQTGVVKIHPSRAKGTSSIALIGGIACYVCLTLTAHGFVRDKCNITLARLVTIIHQIFCLTLPTAAINDFNSLGMLG